MKLGSLFMLVVLCFGTLSCGNKNQTGSKSSSSSSPFSQTPNVVTTVDGLINVDTLAIQTGGTTYQISQQSYDTVIRALNVSFKANIQPDSARNLKAKITATVVQGYSVQSGYQGGAQNVVNVSSMTIYP